MKQRILVLFLSVLLCPLPVRGQSEQALPRLLEEYRAELSLSYEFTANGNTSKGKATLTIQDSCFVLQAGPLSVYNDARECWSVNWNSKEAVVEEAIEFNLQGDSSELLATMGLDPASAEMKYSFGPDGMPSAISAKFADGTSMDVKIRSVKKMAKGDLSFFSFDRSKLSDKWVVTELR